MASHTNTQPSLKRRELLATIGTTALAGCSSSQSISSPTPDTRTTTSPQTISEPDKQTTQQVDCVDQSDYDQLRNRYRDLAEQYEDLEQQHETLRDELQYALSPPYIVSDQRSVSVTYEALNGTMEAWEWDSHVLEAQFTQGFIAREFTYSQLEYLNWDTIGFEGNSKYTRLGEYGRYYQLNPFVIPSNFTPMARHFYDEYRTDRQRLRAAWEFTTQVNDYVSEIQETPRFPLETLLMGGGDCEDSAILLASIIYAMPQDYDVTFWTIDADNPTDPKDLNHVVLSVTLDAGSAIIETTSNEMLPWDRINGYSQPVQPTN